MSCATSTCCRNFIKSPGDRRAVVTPPPLAAPLDFSTVSVPFPLRAARASGGSAFVASQEGRHIEVEIEVEFARQGRVVTAERHVVSRILTHRDCLRLRE